MSQQPTPTNGGARTPEETFIARMKRERARRGWSQARLSKEVNERMGDERRRHPQRQIHSTAITKLEYALQEERRYEVRNLRLNEAVAIADALGLTVPAMLSEDDLDNQQLELQKVRDEWERINDQRNAIIHQLEMTTSVLADLSKRMFDLEGGEPVEEATIRDVLRQIEVRKRPSLADDDAADAVRFQPVVELSSAGDGDVKGERR